MFEFLEFFFFCFKEFIIFIFDDPAAESHFPVNVLTIQSVFLLCHMPARIHGLQQNPVTLSGGINGWMDALRKCFLLSYVKY